MQGAQGNHGVQVGPAATISRRTTVSLAARFVAGAALAVVAGTSWTRVAAAQEEIVLTAAASEVGARPGAAYAQGYAALAAADQDTGAIAVAETSAPPDGGESVGVVPGTIGRCPRC